MDAINLGLGTPEEPFNFEAERAKIEKRMAEALSKNEIPRHLRKTERTTQTLNGRRLNADEIEEVMQYDDYVEKLFQTCEWKPVVQLLRDRLARLPPQFDTYHMLINAEANCGAMDLAAKHAQEAYEWDPLMPESYVMMAKIDLMAMQPDRAEAWVRLAESCPFIDPTLKKSIKLTRGRIGELREAMDKMLADVTPLFCLPDFWLRLSKNLEYYRTFASDETREIVSEVQRDPSTLRHHLRDDKMQWLTSMLSWTHAPLLYSPPTNEELSQRLILQREAAKTSKLMALPPELLLCIIDFCDPPSLGRLPQVSSFWKNLLTTDHRVWKRLYLNIWDPPIIYHVPDWLWVHAFRQRYGLCLSLARIWNRRNGDYNLGTPDGEAKVRALLSKFSFISPSFPNSLSLIPDFVYGNVNHNIYTVLHYRVREQETGEAWPELPSPLTSSSSAATDQVEEKDELESPFLTTFFNQSIMHAKSQPEPPVDPCRRTLNRAVPIFERDSNLSYFDSVLLNVCYFILSRTDYGEESQQAAKVLSALAFHNHALAHHLIQLGAIERFSQFALSDQYAEAADLVGTLLLHKHGIAMEASESLHNATKIFPRLWALNVLQDLRDVLRWVSGLSGVWRGRFFLGVPGYDTPFVEHFLYLHFHDDVNFGHFVKEKDLKGVFRDFKATADIKPEYRFNSTGWIPPGPAPLDPNRGRPEADAVPPRVVDAEEGNIFDEDQTVHEGECRITGSGIDDFGPYRIFGRLHVVYKNVYLVKRYEFETEQSRTVYFGGELGVWGLGGALKAVLARNGTWKWWKDDTEYSLEQLHDMRRQAELNMQQSVKGHKNREKTRRRLREKLTRKIAPEAPEDHVMGDLGLAPLPPPLDAQQQPNPQNPQQAQQQPPAPAPLAHGLRWTEVEFPLINSLVDPLPPPPGPNLSDYRDIVAARPPHLGYVPPDAQDQVAQNMENFVYYESGAGYGPTLQPMLNQADEDIRVNQLCQKPVAKYLHGHGLPLGHTDVLSRLIGCTNSLFQLEHLTEAMHVLNQIEQDVVGIVLPKTLRGTPPLKRFRGETDEIYIRRRLLFAGLTALAGHERYAMIFIHQTQAILDAEYLERADIPFDDKRKMDITHRWIDDWLRHPIRMFVPDQRELQRLLAAALRSPSPQPGIFYDLCLNAETEEALVLSQHRSSSSVMRTQGPVIADEEDEEHAWNQNAIVAALDAAAQDSEDEMETAPPPPRDDSEVTQVQDAAPVRWIEASLALLTVGLAIAVGIRYLTAKRR